MYGKLDKSYYAPRLFELPTALLEYLDLLQGGCSPSTPLGCYTYMIMITKMIEIYNIAGIETIAPRTPCTYVFSSEKKSLRYQLCSTGYAAVRINNCLKRTSVIKVATTDDFRNKWKLSLANYKIDTFVVNKDEWDTKEGHGKSMKNVLHVQQYGKRHLSG